MNKKKVLFEQCDIEDLQMLERLKSIAGKNCI